MGGRRKNASFRPDLAGSDRIFVKNRVFSPDRFFTVQSVPGRRFRWHGALPFLSPPRVNPADRQKDEGSDQDRKIAEPDVGRGTASSLDGHADFALGVR